MTDPTGIGALDLAGCPQCGAPAEVIDRFVLENVDGPVDHVTVRCVQPHRFVMQTSPLADAELRGTPHLDVAILRAVDAGTAELLISVEPSLFLFVDGLACVDQSAARRLVRAGLIGTATPATFGRPVGAQLTPAGRRQLDAV
ncbi:MAG: hypothetical protein L0H84_12450 [Pseudonocardia sp.]|nr:hypothetical protein [Pseudonocardia sp.]